MSAIHRIDQTKLTIRAQRVFRDEPIRGLLLGGCRIVEEAFVPLKINIGVSLEAKYRFSGHKTIVINKFIPADNVFGPIVRITKATQNEKPISQFAGRSIADWAQNPAVYLPGIISGHIAMDFEIVQDVAELVSNEVGPVAGCQDQPLHVFVAAVMNIVGKKVNT